MIEADSSVFPNNAVDIMSIRLATIDADLAILKRPLRRADPVQCIGIYGSQWMPDEESYESGPNTNPILREPSVAAYSITIEALIQDMDEERGLAVHSKFSSLIRAMLYRDGPLLVGLRALSASIGGRTERVQRCGIRGQRYSNNELQGSFLYLSVLDYYLETETK